MELRHLQTFCVVAEVLSFTRAADEPSYSQSTVTAQIQALEAHLGTPLVTEELSPEPVVVVVHPDHPLAGRDAVMPEDMEGEPLLLTEPGGHRKVLERALVSAGVRPGSTAEFWNIEAIKQCVMAGMGISFLPAMAVAAEASRGRLVPLPFHGRPQPQLVTQICWHRDKRLSPILLGLIDVAREILSVPDRVEGLAGPR